MLIVSGSVKMDEADVSKLLPEAKKMIAATLKEEGCIEYAYSFDIDDASKMWITEKWTDQSALDAHFQAGHMATFQKALSKIDIVAADIRLYDANETRILLQK